MNKNLVIIFLILFCFSITSFSQNGNWDVYLAQYNNGPGSTVLNMDLVNVAPKDDLPYIVITGVTFKDCGEDGFPSQSEFKKLYEIDDLINSLISNDTKSEYAGIFTYQCERLNYFYVQDTTNIRSSLIKLYNKKFDDYKFYINIKKDAEWGAYLNFLYPSEEIQEYMSNQKVLDRLQEAGDDLSKERQVDHWIYFKNKEGRDLFIKYARDIGFKVENKDKIEGKELSYQLQISRMDFVDIVSISNLTLKLTKKAKELNGDYDGWETFVIKDK